MVGGSSQSIPLTLKPSPSKAMTQEEKYEKFKRDIETVKILNEVSKRTDKFMDSLFDEFIKDNDDSESAKLWVKIITEVSDNVEDYL
jgi:hypothetical protein